MNIDRNFSTTYSLSNNVPTIKNDSIKKIESVLFLPPNPCRKGEGGLRTQGKFKTPTHKLYDKRSCETVSPLITIITVVFNGVKTLESCLLSVINQSYNNVELIIIDGSSTDGTLETICKYEHVVDYWVSEPDKGIYDAWNKAITLALGEWIAFLGADDFYLEGALAAYVSLINKYGEKNIDYISSQVNLINDSKIIRTVGQKWNWKKFKRYMNVAHPGSLHNRSLFEKYGLYNITYKICGDYEFLLRPKDKLEVAYLKLITVNMTIGGASDSLLSLREMEKAKIISGGRSPLLSYIERNMATIKLTLRTLLWY